MRTLFIDFDSTIVDTHRAIINVLNKHVIKEDEYKIKETCSLEWNLTDVVPDKYKNYVPKVFDSKEFFDELQFFEEVYEILEEISKHTKIIIVSIGTPENIKGKIDWISKKLPFVDFIPIMQSHDNLKMDKSMIDMKNGILIDDHESNLHSCNADIKICYAHDGNDYAGSRKWREQDKLTLNHWRKDIEDRIVRDLLGITE